MPITVDIEIDPARFERIARMKERQIERAAVATVKELLRIAERSQIKSYTQNLRPAKPQDSKYRRRFTLRSASETEIIDAQLPEIRGEWRANETVARHAPYVVGPLADQADIHRGRWKSEEQVAEEVDKAAPDVIDKHWKG